MLFTVHFIICLVAVSVIDPRDRGPGRSPGHHPHEDMMVHHSSSSNKHAVVLLLVTFEKVSHVKTEVIASHGVSNLNSKDEHHLEEASQEKMPAVTSEINSEKRLGSVAEDWLFLAKDLVLQSSASLSKLWNIFSSKRYCSKDWVQLLSTIPFGTGESCIEVSHAEVVLENDNRGLLSGLVTLQANVKLSTPPAIRTTCSQSPRKVEIFYTSPAQPLSLLSIDITVCMQFHLTTVLHTTLARTCPLQHPVHLPQETASSARDETQTIVKLKTTDPVKQLSHTLQTLTDRHFLDYPFWSKLFTFHFRDQSLQKESHRELTYVTNFALGPLNRGLLFSLIVLMTIIFRYLAQPLRANNTKNKGDEIYLKILTRSFFLKWNWNHRQKSQQSLSRKNSQLNTLNSYIFQPWLTKAGWRNHQPFPLSCCSSVSLLCPSCQRHFKHFLANNHRVIQVSPAFLPVATGNPSLDLAHVGYRLATLSALPPSCSGSRIRMADAGFYYLGHGDEVVCYSCQARYSAERRGETPMDIHRQLSPTCQHVLQRDRELSAVTSQFQSTSAFDDAHASAHGQAPGNSQDLGDGQSSANGQSPGNGHTLPNGNPHGDCQASRTQPGQSNPVGESRSQSPETDSEESTLTSAVSGMEQHTPVNASAVITGHRPETHGQHSSNTRTGHSAPVRQGTPAAGGLGAESTPRAAEVNHNGTATPGASTTTTGSQARYPFNISSSSNATPVSSTNGTTVVPPNDSSRGSQPEAAARADSRPLFPTARLDVGGAVYPMYQTMASRRRAFTRWDSTRAPPLDDVLMSGMFYAGYSDCVRCFYCGVGLKHWVVSDDVWDEHVRWRPGCGYLRAVKGDHFIRDTQRRLGVESSASPQDRNRNPPSGNPHSSIQNQDQQPTSSVSSAPNGATTHNGTVANTRATASATAGQPSLSASLATSGAAASESGATSVMSSPALNNCVAVGVDGAANRQILAGLQAEHQDLARQLLCRQCRQSPVNTILLPCGHLVVCESCTESMTSCPLCRNTIQATAKVHFAE